MRYWIWWNDLIQGPFEYDELVSLRAFSEDLLVCMEDRTDWLPASRVADLSSAIEQLRSRRAAPLVPPPPPPRRPPAVAPLQGEFFTESPDQQTLLESDEGPKGPYAYRPVNQISEGPDPYFLGQATMPFHFAHQSNTGAAVIEVLRPKPSRITYAPPPVRKGSPVPKPEEPVREEKRVEQRPQVPLRLLREDLPPAVERRETVPNLRPSAAPSFDEPSITRRNLEWLPWFIGVLISLGILGSAGYWLMDRANTHSAIVEANRLEPPKQEVPMAPVVVPPSPGKTQRALKRISPAVHRASKTVIKAVRKHLPTPEPAVPDVAPPVPTPTPTPTPTPEPTPAPVPTPTPPVQTPEASVPEKATAPDLWIGKQNDAIAMVVGKTIPGNKVTIGNHARDMLQEMHEKELLHAAETGERLYLPDKIVWAALREEGARYRVYLNFLSMQASGERVQSRSYQFIVELDRHSVRTDDPSTQQDMMTALTGPAFKHNPMAVDIESILGGVDHYNKQKMRAIIVKNNRRNRGEQKNIAASMESAKEKVIRATAYFRRSYSDKALANIAKAYDFVDLLKG